MAFLAPTFVVAVVATFLAAASGLIFLACWLRKPREASPESTYTLMKKIEQRKVGSPAREAAQAAQDAAVEAQKAAANADAKVKERTETAITEGKHDATNCQQ